jgi:hypothetical protein
MSQTLNPPPIPQSGFNDIYLERASNILKRMIRKHRNTKIRSHQMHTIPEIEQISFNYILLKTINLLPPPPTGDRGAYLSNIATAVHRGVQCTTSQQISKR